MKKKLLITLGIFIILMALSIGLGLIGMSVGMPFTEMFYFTWLVLGFLIVIVTGMVLIAINI